MAFGRTRRTIYITTDTIIIGTCSTYGTYEEGKGELLRMSVDREEKTETGQK